MAKPLHITFKNAEGIALAARMQWPADQQPHSYAVFAHCFTCSKDLHAVRNIGKALAGRGFAVLSFDFTGLGQSEGNFADSNFSVNVSDLLSAADFLKNEFDAPALLVGHSFGGAAVIQAAASLPSVKAVATIAAPAETSHMHGVFQDHHSEIDTKGVASVNLGGRPFLIKKQFIEDLNIHHITKTLENLRKAILILHSPQDKIVEIENADSLYNAAHHPKSLISLDGADHLLTNRNDSLYAGEVIAAWAHRYLETEEKPILETEHQTVAVVGDKDSGYTTLIKTGKHFMTADEPEDVGGSDFGPSPYQLLASALAACTAMTLRMYANRKGVDVQEIKVHVNHSKRHCEDCETDSPNSRIDHFERLIEAKGNLTIEQQQRLLEIADKCPVHRTLDGNIAIQTRHVQ